MPPVNGVGANNCFRYSSLTCVNRTSANSGVYDSASKFTKTQPDNVERRDANIMAGLLYQNYPSIADYGNSAFNC